MKKLILIPLAALLFGCLPGQETKQIAVSGEAEIDVAPDAFRMSAAVRSRASDKDGALSALSQGLDRLTEQLPQLDGVLSVSIEPSELEIEPVFDAECEQDRRYSEEKACPIDGYFAQVYLTIEGKPATVAGNMFSLASELGAEEVNFDEYYLEDSTDAERDAEQKAFEAARENAQRLAGAANVNLVGPIRIAGETHGSGFVGGYASEDTIVVTGTRIMPRNILAITPPPLTIERSVSVTFEIE